jgi:hypothetical protein
MYVSEMCGLDTHRHGHGTIEYHLRSLVIDATPPPRTTYISVRENSCIRCRGRFMRRLRATIGRWVFTWCGIIGYLLLWLQIWGLVPLPQQARGRSGGDARFLPQYLVVFFLLLIVYGTWRGWSMRGVSIPALLLLLVWFLRAGLVAHPDLERYPIWQITDTPLLMLGAANLLLAGIFWHFVEHLATQPSE